MKQGGADQAFGKVLRELRKGAGVTQETLALDAGLDRTFISMLERGHRQPTLQTLLTLARCLGVPASEIVAKVESLIELTIER